MTASHVVYFQLSGSCVYFRRHLPHVQQRRGQCQTSASEPSVSDCSLQPARRTGGEREYKVFIALLTRTRRHSLSLGVRQINAAEGRCLVQARFDPKSARTAGSS